MWRDPGPRDSGWGRHCGRGKAVHPAGTDPRLRKGSRYVQIRNTRTLISNKQTRSSSERHTIASHNAVKAARRHEILHIILKTSSLNVASL